MSKAKNRAVMTTKSKSFSDIGSYLKQCRNKLNLSQKEVAKQVGYKSSQILSNIERNAQRVPSKKLPKFVKAYNADPKTMFNILQESSRRKLAADLKIKI